MSAINQNPVKQPFFEAFVNSLDHITSLSLLAIAAGVALSWLARLHWIFDLASHLTAHMLAAAALALVYCLLRKRKQSGACALLLCCILGARVLPVFVPADSHGSGDREIAVVGRQTLKLVACNLLSSNTQYAPVRGKILALAPDVLVVLEFNREWQLALEGIRRVYPHNYELPREDNFGIAVYSKLATEFSVQHLTDSRVPLLLCRLEMAGTQVNLLAAHPLPPIGESYSISRNKYLSQLAEIANRQANVIVAGDLNVTPYSPYFLELQKAGSLRDSRQGFGVHSTWPSRLGVFGIPIDHILVSDSIQVLGRGTNVVSGSDHRAVSATLLISRE